MELVYEEYFNQGTELKELQFDSFLDWFVRVSDIKVHWQNQPTYILSQFVYLFGGLATLLHALVRGGRLPYLWFGSLLHGFVVESLSYTLPDVDNFWHSQTPIIFLGRRFPLHIMILYPCFLYNASIAAAKMRLPKWSEPFAVGLLVVLIDIPYDIVSVRFMHWFWHDTDPNIFDRHYWVPWNSYYFHATFAASFTFWFHFLRRRICSSPGKWIADKSISKELICTLLAGLLGTPGGIFMFLPVYHPLHDEYKIHSEVTFTTIFAIFLLLAWTGDRQPKNYDYSRSGRELNRSTPKNGESKRSSTHWSTWVLLAHLVLHYVTFWAIAAFFNPENEVATGIKERIGPCDEYAPVLTATGKVLQKRKYLCPTDYDEQYFDWSCLPNKKPPSDGSLWYTTCGVPFENRVEYVAIVSLICLVAGVVFVNLHFCSWGDDVFGYRDEGVAVVQGGNKKKVKKN